jgi:quercetin dioxygenase-like cupin family protein
MSDKAQSRGRAIVMQPGEGNSFWQPVPANGHADPKLVPNDTGFDGMSMGFQTIAPNSRVREHSHADQIELQICFCGTGRVVVDDVSHDIAPGTSCFLGYDVRHEIINESDDEELVMMWVISPAGLEDFFGVIGRARSPGEDTPEPFARPENVVEVERGMGMNDT